MKLYPLLLLSLLAFPLRGEMIGLANSSFDSADDKAWRLTNAFRIDRHGGSNGSGGLVWSSAEPTAKVSSAMQDVKGLRRGDSVRLSAVAKVEGLKHKERGYGAQVTLELYDTSGKWIAALYAHPDKKGRAPDGEWVVRTASGVLPPNFGRARVAIHVAEETAGLFAVDNVTLERVEARPVSFVASSAYRNLAVAGKVRFHAALETPPDAVGRAKAVFSWTDADGVRRRTPADEQGEGEASVTLDAGRLAKGAQEVECELQVDGRRIGAAAVGFTRAEATPERRVWIDGKKRCIVDGRPFFPIGIYCYPALCHLETLTNTPFNTVLHYKTPDRKLLAMFERLGLKTCAAIERSIPEDELRARIAEARRSPAVLAWYLGDEHPTDRIPELKRLYGMLCGLDPDHPVYLVQDFAYNLRCFLPTADVIGMDIYPVAERPVRQVTDRLREGRAATFDVPVQWGVPQAFDWSWFGRSKEKNRFPTEGEMRSMLWQFVANGANGLFTYRYNGATSETWKVVLKTHREVAERADVILSDEPCPEVASSDEGLVCRAWVKGGALYVLACNILDRPLSARATLSWGDWRPAAADFGPAPTGSGRAFDFALPPLGVSFARLPAR